MKEKDFNEYKEANEPHIIQEVICVHCKHRWMSVRHIDCKLKDMECPCCNNVGYVIGTGEVIM